MMVDRRLDQHRIALLGKSPHCDRECKHDTWRAGHPLRLQSQVMAFLIPRCHRIKVRLICPAVTENPVIYCLFQRLNHTVRRSEIHIRHPERQNIIRLPIFFLKIMLDRPSMGRSIGVSKSYCIENPPFCYISLKFSKFSHNFKKF